MTSAATGDSGGATHNIVISKANMASPLSIKTARTNFTRVGSRFGAVTLFIERMHFYRRGSGIVEMHVHAPRPAADLAIFHVLLVRTAARIESDLDDFTAIRAYHFRLGIRHAIT